MILRPFADDSATTTIGDLNVENGTDIVTISGSLDIGRDKAGLGRAHALKEVIDAIVGELEAAGDLPEKADVPTTPTKQVPNPFS